MHCVLLLKVQTSVTIIIKNKFNFFLSESVEQSIRSLSIFFDHYWFISIDNIFPLWHLQYLDLFLTRVDSLRRRISTCGVKDDGLNYNLIRATFEVI